ncbi:MAG: glycosyltransferase family 4 protein [Nitrospirae bacterium]|nr:glycosyltransferase family 4 protein [Nitrospirota bacterium]
MNNFYAAFDVFPAFKGASSHIACNVRAMERFSRTVTLACLGYADMPIYQEEGSIAIRRCLGHHPNYLKRTEIFGRHVAGLLRAGGNSLTNVHFRDIWSGLPIINHPMAKHVGKIFEVNGLPSIELPTHYPRLRENEALLRHIRHMEDLCLKGADKIITVSSVTASYLKERGADETKITLIPNAVYEDSKKCEDSEGKIRSKPIASIFGGKPFILYSGTLSPWQGVDVLIKAYYHVAHSVKDVNLLLACSSTKYLKPTLKPLDAMGLRDKVKVIVGVSRERLATLYEEAAITVAPLTRCDRNELQGACPVKIIESMSHGTPVVASGLASIREIIDHGKDGWLVTPDSPRSLANGMIRLLNSGELVESLGQAARIKIKTRFGMDLFESRLKRLYEEIGR